MEDGTQVTRRRPRGVLACTFGPWTCFRSSQFVVEGPRDGGERGWRVVEQQLGEVLVVVGVEVLVPEVVSPR